MDTLQKISVVIPVLNEAKILEKRSPSFNQNWDLTNLLLLTVGVRMPLFILPRNMGE